MNLRKLAEEDGILVDPYNLRRGVTYIVKINRDYIVLTYREEAYFQTDLGTLETYQEILDAYGEPFIGHALEMINEGPEGAFFEELDEPIAFRNLEFEQEYIITDVFYDYERTKNRHISKKALVKLSKRKFGESSVGVSSFLFSPKTRKTNKSKTRKTNKSKTRKTNKSKTRKTNKSKTRKQTNRS